MDNHHRPFSTKQSPQSDERGLKSSRPALGTLKFIVDDTKGRWEKDPDLEEVILKLNKHACSEMNSYQKKAASGVGWDPDAVGSLLYGLENLRKRVGGQDHED